MVDRSVGGLARRPLEEIVGRIRRGGPALVALSGGVDSALVASLAREALGAAAIAVTLTGPAVSARELERAREVARATGIQHFVLPVDPLSRPEYRENPTNRCFFCRTVEAERLRSFGDPRGIRQYLDGVHVDDLSDERPGLQAMDAAGFFHPLAWAGWTKADVRAEARARGLPNSEQPSDACLASRIAHGSPITGELLGRVEAAESLLLARGFRRVRVRVHGSAARVEVDPGEVPRLSNEPLASAVVHELRSLGFEPVTIDPLGYHGNRREATRTS
jgi:pyridinium-3,5-biscarboxylic acid mononucleotide sulfurtransferase